ncbi:hypothetical protein MTO96_031264 [Rhipicephalus appendiculatus]
MFYALTDIFNPSGHNVDSWLLTAAMLYGKVAETNKKARLLKGISIPKRWFKHFYQFGVVIFTSFTLFMVRSYVFGFPLPGAVIKLINFFEPRPTTTVSATSILLVQLLETCQVYRRCYECMFVSVYSNVRMHVWHYLMGYLFYFGVQLTILANAPISSGSTAPRFSLSDISAHHIIGTVIFLWAFYVQFDSHIRMASLRKDNKGNVVTLNHKIPQGQPNTTWWLMMAWNWSNQVAVSFFSHNWYRENFPSYPKRRKAIIPFVL